jgi:hypothetical protein
LQPADRKLDVAGVGHSSGSRSESFGVVRNSVDGRPKIFVCWAQHFFGLAKQHPKTRMLRQSGLDMATGGHSLLFPVDQHSLFGPHAELVLAGERSPLIELNEK